MSALADSIAHHAMTEKCQQNTFADLIRSPTAVEKAGYTGLAERREGELRRRHEPWQGIGRKFEDPLRGRRVRGFGIASPDSA
jgi:hypothetical protein